MALCKYPSVFKAAVAGAPVTSWDGYDTCYTERCAAPFLRHGTGRPCTRRTQQQGGEQMLAVSTDACMPSDRVCAHVGRRPRYMSLPQDNEAGYAESSIMTHVDKLTGHLMLVHGMIDEVCCEGSSPGCLIQRMLDPLTV